MDKWTEDEERLDFIEDCLVELADPQERCILIRIGNKMEQKLAQEWLEAGLIVFRERISTYNVYDLNA